MDNSVNPQNDALKQPAQSAEVELTNTAEKQQEPPIMLEPSTTNAVPPSSVSTPKEAETTRLPLLPFLATLSSYVIGFLWVSCLIEKYDWMPLHGMTTVFTAIFFGWGEFAMKRIPRPNKECWFWLACALIIALGIDMPRSSHGYPYSIEPDRLMEGWDVFLLHCIGIYWVLCRSGKLIEKRTGSMFLLDALTGPFIAPFNGLFNRIKHFAYCIKAAQNKSGHFKNAAISFIAILLVLPVLTLVIKLLGHVDDSFKALWTNISVSLTLDKDTIVRLIVGYFASCFIFSLVSSCILREKPIFSSQSIRQTTSALRCVPQTGCMVIIGSFIALYLLFFGFQGSHLISAFWGEIPDTLTASKFARTGFFELCAVMGINLGLILGGATFCNTAIKDSPSLRIMTQILLAESLLLAVTAASKLILYIDRFGFTTLRLLSFWFVLVLASGCILYMISLHNKMSFIDKWIWFTAATFSILCFL